MKFGQRYVSIAEAVLYRGFPTEAASAIPHSHRSRQGEDESNQKVDVQTLIGSASFFGRSAISEIFRNISINYGTVPMTSTSSGTQLVGIGIDLAM
jgi:hypothetical protein